MTKGGSPRTIEGFTPTPSIPHPVQPYSRAEKQILFIFIAATDYLVYDLHTSCRRLPYTHATT